jgi:hypothetical protein
MDSITYMGPWVWSFIPLSLAIIAVCGGMLYVGSEKFSHPSTARLRREESERLHEIEREQGERTPELV